jgi:hypothetical protein
LEPCGPLQACNGTALPSHFILDYNCIYMFRPNCRAIFRQIFEQVECTIDNAFNLGDLLLQVLGKIIVVYYIKDLKLQLKCTTLYNKLKSLGQTYLAFSAHQYVNILAASISGHYIYIYIYILAASIFGHYIYISSFDIWPLYIY